MQRRSLKLSQQLLYSRSFSSSTTRCLRAVVYEQNGDPSAALRVMTFSDLPPPRPASANIKFLLSAINPADINVVEGVYPSKPQPEINLASSSPGSSAQPIFVGGNEGVAEVLDVGDGSGDVKKGDWVIMTSPQSGTWSSTRNVPIKNLLKIPGPQEGMSEEMAATLAINPPTAYNMVHSFLKLHSGDWLIQNGANSAVGQAVIQIAAQNGIKTINLVRDREDITALREHLSNLGATQVVTYEELSDKGFRHKAKGWLQGKELRLALNCVGGPTTTAMAKLLGHDAHLVSYGAMSKQPLTLPTSLFIFKNLQCHGFWQTRWYAQSSQEARSDLMRQLAAMMIEGKLKVPEHEIVALSAKESDEVATGKVRSAITRMMGGKSGKKPLLRIEDV